MLGTAPKHMVTPGTPVHWGLADTRHFISFIPPIVSIVQMKKLRHEEFK